QDIERRLQQFKDSSLFVQKIKLYIPELDITIHNDLVNKEMPENELDALIQQHNLQKTIYPIGDELILSERYPRLDVESSSAKLWLEVILSRKNMEDSLKKLVQYNGGEALIIDHE